MATAVTVLCPNARRVAVKVSPNKRLQEIMEEAAKKQGYISDQCSLQFHNRTLDCSLTFRLSGLPNNACLDLVENKETGPKIVEIALQIIGSGRNVKKFPNDTTLLDLLKAFELDSGMSLLNPKEGNVQPICTHMNVEVIGISHLSATTLKSLGIIQGKELLRYTTRVVSEEKMNKIKETLRENEQKQKQLENVFEIKRQENIERERIEKQREKEFEAALSAAKSTSGAVSDSAASSDVPAAAPDTPRLAERADSRMHRLHQLLTNVNESLEQDTDIDFDYAINAQRAIMLQRQNEAMEFENFKFPESPAASSSDSVIASSTVSESEVPSCDRQPVWYRMDDTAIIAEVRETPNDDFFQVTTRDVQQMQQLLKEDSQSMSARALVSQKVIIEKDNIRKREAWKHSVIRVLFPNKLILQLSFISLEKVEKLYQTVAEYLRKNAKFTLSLPPNQKVDNSKMNNFVEAGLSPTANLILVIGGDSKEKEIRFPESIQTFSTAEIIAKEWLSVNSVFVPYRPTVTQDNSANGQSVDYGKRQSNKVVSSGSGPKWFKGAKR